MMEDDSGNLFCTSKALCEALRINDDTLRKTASRHQDELTSLSVTNSHAKEFIKNHREEFGVQRVRSDMRLWSEEDMILIAITARSSESKEFRSKLIRFIKENARRDTVSRDQHDQLVARLDKIEEFIPLFKTAPAMSN